MVSYPSINLVDLIIDEVALEGLDGITIEALWLRLANRLHNPLPFSKAFMVQIWSVCVKIREFAFYELETAREPLVIFNRYEFVDPDLGIILEPENVLPDIYPHCPIYDAANDIKGSCSTYHTRKDVTQLVRSLSLDEATTTYGQKLVIVASQSARNHALMGDEVSPILELNVIQYCFLERVGRSRYHGEVTQGKISLNALKEDPKSLFYHRKFLLRHKLITKQMHHQKSGSHSCNGSLLHLPRFFVERKPKIMFLAEEVIKILKSKPNCVAEYDEIKRKLQIENSIKKLFRTSFFQKVVKTDIRVPYRTLYPNATPAEWQKKNEPSKEKNIKVVQLLSPNIDIIEALNKEEIQEEEEPQELNISCHKYSVPYLKQANTIIEAERSDGVCQGSLARIMGLTKLQSRTILRNVVKANIVATYMNDMGRQRLAKYVSKKYEKGSKLSKQFKKEMHKIKELTKQIATESDNLEKSRMIIKQENSNNDDKETVEVATKPNIINNNDNEEVNDIVEKEEDSKVATVELQKLFHIVNRVLYKYRITKRANRYKRTFSNYLSEKINEVHKKEETLRPSSILLQISELSKNEKAAAASKNIKVELTVLESTNDGKSENEGYGFMEGVQNEKKFGTNITYRLLRRANMIIESVKEHQVIDDITKLMKMIHEEEDKEGYDVKIDKKSVLRLLKKLSKDNLVKRIGINLSGCGREKHMTFICDPNIDIDSAVIQSVIEQVKLKFYLAITQKPKLSMKQRNIENCESNKNENDVTNKSENDQSTAAMLKYKCGPRVSRKYGYSPKFIRMQVLHIFLFYLIYEHPGEQTFSKEEQIKVLRNNFNITEELIEEFSTIYTKDVSWKMFVPPLPQYTGWPRGWTLMSDILLRLPLSIFLKIHYISFLIPDMEQYVNHPIRKHYLVRDLPLDIRNSLLDARKYIFHIHETVTRLCYFGLVQFGPQKLKEKDQVFIYLNRRTELMDTTSSAPSYHIIEDKSYPVMKYNFDEIQTVEKYWYDLWNTCINTPLGGRLVVQGKDIVLEDLGKKSDMLQALVARSPEEAVRMDIGKVPGDRKGAAGIDSACFAHLKRNWSWAFSSSSLEVQQSKTKRKSIIYERDAYLSKIKASPIRFTEFPGFKTVSGPTSLNATELRKKAQTKNENIDEQKKYEALTNQRSTKQKSYVRRVLPRKRSSKRRIKYDEVDYRALQRMHKLRVDWEPHEDKILLICKEAMVYLCPNPRKQVITFSAVRDVLRTYSYSSHNKTSRACQRRLLYMLKQQRNVNKVALGVEELKQNFFLKKRFGGVVEKLKERIKNSHELEEQVTEEFKSLVAYIVKKYYDISQAESQEPLPVPSTAQGFNLFYKVVYPTKPFYNRGFTKDVRTVNDIHSAVINSVIHSSMCCGKDRRSWAYQLFKIYQQYPEVLLRTAMAKICSDQMVTIKKNQLTARRKYGNYMPMSSSQYQLSNNYVYKFHTKWPYSIFSESYDVFFKLSSWFCANDSREGSDNFNGIEVLPVTGGVIAAIHDYIIRDQIDFDVEIPDQVIMLDPALQEKDETYFRIAQRYQDVLAGLDNLKFTQESSLQSNEALSSLEQRDGKQFDPEVDILQDNDTQNVDGDVFSDLDAERNTEEREKKDPEDELNDDDEQNVIKFQDGTKIVLDKDAVKRLMVCDDAPTTETEENKAQNENCSSVTDETVSELKNKTQYLKSNVDLRDKLITSRNKRQRADDEQRELDEPVKKRKKVEENSIETSNKADLSKCSDVEMVEIHDSNVSNEEAASSKDCEAALQSKKKNERAFTRVSDILKRNPVEQRYLNSYCKIDDSDLHKRYTRIALLRMREELSELTVADSHHAHEYFVVNMFKVYYSLYRSDTKNSENETFKDLSMPPDLVPLKLNAVNDLLEEISRFSVCPMNDSSYNDFKKNLDKDLAVDSNDLDEVYEFVRDKKELGASIQELIDEFEERLGEGLYRIVSVLTENRFFLRAGVATVRYVHHRYADSWVIHSYKICRLEKESLTPVPKGTVYATESKEILNKDNATNTCAESNKNSGSLNANEEDCQTESKDRNENSDKDTSNHSDEECNSEQIKRRAQRSAAVQSQKDASKVAKQLDLKKQEIRVVIKPWIRIDGALNRRVLDRMLGSILSYCLTHPGIALTKIQNRFVPPLQPCHTRELVEILVKLGCLEKVILKKPRVTLFSKPTQVKPKITNNDWAVEEDIFLEPTSGAMLKFGIFLSTKMYNTDFIK
ncbi:general transcription factor 3C polypeptide 1 [Xylocopa sonorina]|uniref:general transcription factor 3C polypeptide 1 n=1 Tax=Xylocopa sonorina TaxID=1818115 RepID=UPI00403B2A7C